MTHMFYSTAQHPTEAALLDALDWCAVSAPELAGAKRDNYDEVAKLRQMLVAYFDSHAVDAVQADAQCKMSDCFNAVAVLQEHGFALAGKFWARALITCHHLI